MSEPYDPANPPRYNPQQPNGPSPEPGGWVEGGQGGQGGAGGYGGGYPPPPGGGYTGGGYPGGGYAGGGQGPAQPPPPPGGGYSGGYGQQPPPPSGYSGGYGQGPGGPPPGTGGRRRGKGLIIAAVAALAVLTLLVGGIGTALLLGGDDGTDEDDAPPAAGAVSSVDDVDTATIQIVSQGSFVDPQEGAVSDAAGAGTGFFIDPSGIAVTNNHVVTGAATLEVRVNGETEPRNARILGTSECSDLAVIDVDGEDFPYLEFASTPPDTGVDVFAAGFPLGDPEFTLTSGIISKASASGETNWASVDDVVEHSATINPGNSGGPLVDDAGRVVAVNYAGSSDTNQYYAIAAPTVTSVVEELREGRYVDYLGINGQAFVSEDESFSGVFVSAVESGSPAADLGLAGGDVLTRMEGLSLGTDGTMADYCDILRTQGTDAEISTQVLRVDTEEVLQGTFNSGEPLEVFEALGSELEDDVAVGSVGPPAYSGYTPVTDDSGAIRVEVPLEWADVAGAPLDDGSASLSASTDMTEFNANFVTPGVVIASLEGGLDADAALTELLSSIGATEACPTSGGRQPYDDGLYTGSYELLSGCQGTDAAFTGIVASPDGGEFVVFVGVQIIGEADFEALDRIIETFTVTP